MAEPRTKISIVWETRSCIVDGEYGEFQIWEASEPVHAVIEFSDGVRRVDAEKVQFCDETHARICTMKKMKCGAELYAGRQDQGGD